MAVRSIAAVRRSTYLTGASPLDQKANRNSPGTDSSLRVPGRRDERDADVQAATRGADLDVAGTSHADAIYLRWPANRAATYRLRYSPPP